MKGKLPDATPRLNGHHERYIVVALALDVDDVQLLTSILRRYPRAAALLERLTLNRRAVAKGA